MRKKKKVKNTIVIPTHFALEVETVRKLEELCQAYYRGKGDMVDYLVAKEYAEFTLTYTPSVGLSAGGSQTQKTEPEAVKETVEGF